MNMMKHVELLSKFHGSLYASDDLGYDSDLEREVAEDRAEYNDRRNDEYADYFQRGD